MKTTLSELISAGGSLMAAIVLSQTDLTKNRSHHNIGFPLINSNDVFAFQRVP